LTGLSVQQAMTKDHRTAPTTAIVWIDAGAALFLVALAGSAVMVPEL